jgi:hypothetical protein
MLVFRQRTEGFELTVEQFTARPDPECPLCGQEGLAEAGGNPFQECSGAEVLPDITPRFAGLTMKNRRSRTHRPLASNSTPP